MNCNSKGWSYFLVIFCIFGALSFICIFSTGQLGPRKVVIILQNNNMYYTNMLVQHNQSLQLHA